MGETADTYMYIVRRMMQRVLQDVREGEISRVLIGELHENMFLVWEGDGELADKRCQVQDHTLPLQAPYYRRNLELQMFRNLVIFSHYYNEVATAKLEGGVTAVGTTHESLGRRNSCYKEEARPRRLPVRLGHKRPYIHVSHCAIFRGASAVHASRLLHTVENSQDMFCADTIDCGAQPTPVYAS